MTKNQEGGRLPENSTKGRRQDVQNPKENNLQTLPRYATNHDVLLESKPDRFTSPAPFSPFSGGH